MPESTFTIFHATDLRPDGGIAFKHSVALARDASAKLVSIHARTPGEEREKRGMPDAAQLMREWGDGGALDFEAREHECCEDPVDTLLDALREVRPDLLVVGTHQSGAVDRLLKGSVSNSLAANAAIPTLFLPIGQSGFVSDAGELSLRRVLIPIGNDSDFEAAISVAYELAERLGRTEVEFHLIHAGEAGVVETELAPEHEGWTWVRATVEGDLAKAISDYADSHAIDLIVMATRGQDGILDVLRGTRTQQTLQRTHRPLLLVPE